MTSLYREPNEDRRSEIVECFNRNLAHTDIQSVCLLLENIDACPLKNEKVKTRWIKHRPTYNDFIDWIVEMPVSYSDLTIITNSDIYFDRTISVLAKALKPNQCAVLSRWDIDPYREPVLFNRNDSQDTWVFRGPLREVQGDFCVGVPRCDNRFLCELKRAGYEVINPSFSIRSYHLHEGIREEYQNDNLEHFVEPPYAYLWPHNLWSLPRTLLHNLRHPDTRIGWRFDRRKFLSSMPVRAISKIVRGVGSSLTKSNT